MAEDFRVLEGDDGANVGAGQPAAQTRNLGPGMTLPNPFAGITDFGTKQVAVEVGDGQFEYRDEPITASEWLGQNVDPSNPIWQAVVNHSSTSVTPLTDASGKRYFEIAGKTGGPNRERYKQLYVEQGDKLVPVGKGQFFTGEHPDAMLQQFVGTAAGMFGSALLPGVGSFIGQALGVSTQLGTAIANVALQVAQGRPLNDALITAGISFGAPQIFNNPTVAKIAGDLASAAATGGDVGKAAIKSVIGAVGPDVLDGIRPTGDQVFDSGLASAVASAASAKLTGGDALQSAISGFTAGVQGAARKEEAATQRAASGAGFVGDYEDLSGAGPADYVVGERDPNLTQVGLKNNLLGILQSGLAELGQSLLSAGREIGIAPQTLTRAIDYLKVIEQGGESLIDADVRQQAANFTNKIYSVASNPNASTSDIARAVVEATLENPLGSLTLVSKELVQELPTLLIPGKAVAMLGNFALNIAESAGAQALQKIDELRKANPNMTNEELIAAARKDAGIAGVVTAAVSLIPGANTKALQPLIEGFNEFLEEGLTTYLTTGDKNKALGNAVLGGVLGTKTTGAIQTGEDVVAAAQQTLPSLGTIVVKGTRLPLDPLEVVPSTIDKTAGGTKIPAGTAQIPTDGAQIPGGMAPVTAGGNVAVVVSTDPANNTALVIDQNGKSQIVNGTDPSTGALVNAGQSVTLGSDGQIKVGGVTDGQISEGGVVPAPQEKSVSPYSANVQATPKIVAELLALKGLPSSDRTIEILLAGNPTVAQVGQEIQMLANMRGGVTPATAQQQQTGGTPTVKTGQQTGPTVITQGGVQPEVAPTTPIVTDGTIQGTPSAIDLTGGITRTNIDTISPVDTVSGIDTLPFVDTVGGGIDTTPAGIDTIAAQDSLPFVDTTPTVDTTPVVDQNFPVTRDDVITDDEIIRILGLDKIDTTPAEEVKKEPAEEKKEPLTVVPKTVYTPPPGVRVAEGEASAFPTRAALSEREGEDVYGTPEEEQEPVWNIRSLKLRKALRI